MMNNIVRLSKMSNEIGLEQIIALINLFEKDYGHYQSVRLGKPVDTDLNPLPWYTYAAIEYLKQFDFSDKNIFEYGSGNSSIFWSSLAKSVTSVEIDAVWFDIISKSKPSNLNLCLKEKQSEYVNFIENGNILYDLIVIDGAYRYDCAKVAVKYLSDDGLIIVDNSERYPKLCSDIRSHDLIQVDFFGFGPINYYTWTTSLFFQRKFRLDPLNKLPHFGIGSLCEEFSE
ncbi:O-methyltransferase [Nodularia spumigena]|uniref:hypothetical protein n=1 Tax=Nodularia spumigena TaxID=70799 RepID=UPI002B219F84|nr:hypothetical protein [Nodularia spumigena]MEA5559228.1 hypothetical protein [Nodularia spumigena CH309]